MGDLKGGSQLIATTFDQASLSPPTTFKSPFLQFWRNWFNFVAFDWRPDGCPSGQLPTPERRSQMSTRVPGAGSLGFIVCTYIAGKEHALNYRFAVICTSMTSIYIYIYICGIICVYLYKHIYIYMCMPASSRIVVQLYRITPQKS